MIMRTVRAGSLIQAWMTLTDEQQQIPGDTAARLPDDAQGLGLPFGHWIAW